MKKLGIVIALDSDKMKGSLYLSKGDLLTPNISSARVYRGKAQMIESLCKQLQPKFLNFKISYIEKWSDDFN